MTATAMLKPAILALLLALPASAAEYDTEGRIVLAASERKACIDGGGCVVIPQALAIKLLALAEAGMKCRPNSALIPP